MTIYSAQDVIKAFMASLDNTNLSGTAALDEAVRASSNFNSIQEVIDKMVSDCDSNDSDTFLQEYCGIILDNEDTGAITGSDAGGTAVKNAEDIVPETGALNTTFTGNSFTKNGLTFQLSNLFDNNSLLNHYGSTTYNSLGSDEKYMWQGLYTWWADSALNLISESYGSNYSFDNPYANIKNIHTGFINDADDDGLAAVASWAFGNGVFDLDLEINNAYYSNFDTSNVNGIASNDDDLYLDRALAHEFTHAVMAANINNYNELPTVIVEGMAELTHGIDDIRNIEIEYLAKNADKLNDNLNLDDEYIDSFGYAAGYMLLRYFAKQVSDAAVDAVWSVDGTTAILANDSETLLTVSGLKSGLTAEDGVIEGIDFNDDRYIVLSNSVLDSATTVSLTNNGILTGGLKLDSDVEVAEVNNVWRVANATASYQSSVTGNGFNISNDGKSISYVTEGETETLVTIGGVTNINGLSINEDTISVAASAVNNSVKIDDSYKFAFTGNLANKTIVGSDNNDSVYINGNSALVSLGGGDNYIKNSGNNVTITGGNDSDYIENTGNNVNINTGAGSDTVLNRASNVTITASDVINLGVNVVVTANHIYNENGNVTLIGTDDDNEFDNFANSVNINTGNGDDTIINNGSYVTIDAGEGDDFISNTGTANVVNFGAGNDTVVGIGASDTVTITGYYSSSADGDDLIIAVGDDSLRVVDGVNVDFTVDGQEIGDIIINADESVTINNVIFTAAENSTLSANAEGTLTISEGVIGATAVDTTTPKIIFNASNGAFDFNCEKVSAGLSVTILDNVKVNYTGGTVTYYADKLVAEQGNIGIAVANGVFNIDIAVADNNTTFNIDEDENITLISDGTTKANINVGETSIGEISFNGTFTYDTGNNDIEVASASTLTASIFDRTIQFTTTDNAGGVLDIDRTNFGVSFTPNNNDGSLMLSVTQNNSTRATTLSCTGKVTYTLGNNVILADGTTVTNTWDSGYTLKLTSTGNATGTVYLDEDGLQISDAADITAELTTAAENTFSNITINGTATFNAGTVTLSNNSTLTGTLGDKNISIQAATSTAQISFDDEGVIVTGNNVIYNSVVYSGSFKIADGVTILMSDVNVESVTSAQSFNLAEIGNYTINNMNISTASTNLTVDAASDKIAFNPNSGTVVVDGVSLTGYDTVSIGGNSVTGSAGDDTVKSNVGNVTINAGAGDDVIDIGGANNNVIVYLEDDGNDSIVGYDSNDTINFGAAYASIVNDNDVIFNVGDNYVTLDGAANVNLNVIGNSSTNVTAAELLDGLLKRGTTLADNFIETETVVTPAQFASSETWTIQSADELTLYATHFSPATSNGRWVVLVHGYGQNQQAMYSYVDSYLQQGYNVITPDMRATGNSGGDYLTMGVNESHDVALWTQEIVNRNGAALITLHGKNMGAATVLMASARNDIENVAAVIADGSYNNAYDYFKDNMQAALNVNPDPVLMFVDALAKDINGCSLKDANPLTAVTAANVATLFIDNTDLYNASNASAKQSDTNFSIDNALAFVDKYTPTNIVFNGRNFYVTNADGVNMNVTASNYGTVSGGRLTLKEIGKALNVLISGNSSMVVFGTNTVRTSGSAVATVRADDGYFNINGNPYLVSDDSIGIIIAADNHISAINSLDGTISGNFSLGETAINTTNRIYILGDDDVTVDADSTNRIKEISGVNSGATVVSAGTNSTLKTEGKGTFTFDSDPSTAIIFNTEQEEVIFEIDGRGKINTYAADSSTIIGSTGNDTINAIGNNLSINAGAGDDIITFNSDTANNVVDYYAGNGNDTIFGLNASDTLNIVTGAYSTVLSDDDVIITVGDNTILAKEAANTNFVVNGLETGAFYLLAGESKTIGDIVFAADEDTTMTANIDSSLTINDGKVTATFVGAINPEIMFDASDGAFTFSCAKVDINNDSAMAVTAPNDLTVNYLTGTLTYYSDKITANNSVSIVNDTGKNSADFNFNNATLAFNNNQLTFTDNAASSANLQLSDTSVTNISVNGTVAYNRNNHNLDVDSGTVLTATLADRTVTLTASDSAGGTFIVNGDSFSFNPYSNDGDLILSVTHNNVTRTATLNCQGTVTYSLGGNITLASGTTISSTWADGFKLTLSAVKEVGGTVNIKDDALEIIPNDFAAIATTLVTPAFTINNIKFDTAVTYSNGKITLADNATLIGYINNTGIEVSAMDADAVVSFDDSGIIFKAGTNGTVVGTLAGFTNTYRGTFKIVNTDIPVVMSGTSVTTASSSTQKFLLADSGAYTINSFNISTTADDVEVSVNGDTISFNPNSALVTVAGKQFGGDGIVSVSSDGTFILGDGAAVVLSSAANETINSIPFRLSRNVGGNITVACADNGFDVMRTVTGGVLNENFSVDGDNDYSVAIVASGIGTISGISSGATVNGGASLSTGVDSVNNFSILTDGNSIYTFGKSSYTVAGDDSVLFNADFDNDSATLKTVSSLDGTISGDFSTAPISVNGIDDVYILGDSFVDVIADPSNGISAVKNISNGATIQAAGKSSTLTTNNIGTFTFGNNDNSLSLRTRNSSSIILIDDNGSVIFASDNTTVTGSANNDTITSRGNGVFINALAGNDFISNSGNRVTINAGDGADTIYNSGTNARINAGSGNVNIVNSADSVSVYSADGTDFISNSGNFVTINSGDDADSIFSTGYSNYIDIGAGNDTILADLTSSTIDAGFGNDFISLSANSNGNLIHYDNGDGNDTIAGLTADDTLKIATGNFTSAVSGEDILVNVGKLTIIIICAILNLNLIIGGVA